MIAQLTRSSKSKLHFVPTNHPSTTFAHSSSLFPSFDVNCSSFTCARKKVPEPVASISSRIRKNFYISNYIIFLTQFCNFPKQKLKADKHRTSSLGELWPLYAAIMPLLVIVEIYLWETYSI